MKLLVTGATGFMGRAIVDELTARHEVRALVRPTSELPAFSRPVEPVVGDVTDRASLTAAMEGCDGVVHAAALVRLLAPARRFDEVNVGGTSNVLDAARETGVGKVLYVSSFIALGPTEDAPGGELDESAPPRERRWINDYERTKTAADRLARAAIEDGAPLTVVYPGVTYGPGALTDGNIVVRHLLDLAGGRVPALLGTPERRWNLVHVEDVARGIATVLERAPRGGRYLLGGENVRLGDFYGAIAERAGVAVPRRRLPHLPALAAGHLMKLWARLTGTRPRLTPDLVETYRHDWAFSSARAERELGYSARSFNDGLDGTVAWLKVSGAWPA